MSLWPMSYFESKNKKEQEEVTEGEQQEDTIKESSEGRIFDEDSIAETEEGSSSIMKNLDEINNQEIATEKIEVKAADIRSDIAESLEEYKEEVVSGGGQEEESVVEVDTERTKDLAEEDEMYNFRDSRIKEEAQINFRKCVKWPEVRELIESLGEGVQVRHIVSAFFRVKDLMPRASNQFLDELSEILILKTDLMTASQVSKVIHACGKLRYIKPSLFEAMSKRVINWNLAVNMDGSDMAMVAHSLGVLCRFQLLVEAADKGMRTIDLYQLYAKTAPPVLFSSQDELLAAISKEMAVPNKLTGFNTQELSNMVYGLGLLRYRDPAALKALSREIGSVTRIPAFSAMEISNVVYGFGLLDFKDDPLYYTVCNEYVRMARVQEFSTQNLANILYGFARVNFIYPPFLKALVYEIKQPERLSRFREQELANVLSCAAMLSINDKEMYHSLLGEITQKHRLPKFLEYNLSTIILGLTRARVREEAKLKLLAAEMQRPERLPNYTSKDICDILMGFNNLEFMDDGFMLGLVAELRKPQRIEQTDVKVWQSCRANVFSWSLAFPF